MSRVVYVNGNYVPENDGKVSVFDRGFLFADGIYEVTAVINGKLVDYDPHMERLERSGMSETVVAEQEAALELARHALHRFGVPSQQATRVIQTARARLR